MSREKPILFSGPMVRAILDGRKTQTRRLFTHRHAGAIDYIGPSGEEHDPSNWGYFFDGPDHHGYMVLGRGHDERQNHGRISIPCPYGEPGDRLWVRETWSARVAHAHGTDGCDCADLWMTYPADGAERFIGEEHVPCEWTLPVAAQRGRNVPSIHMPRWASRITLEISDVRVQRLQDISESDILAEGVEQQDHEVLRDTWARLWDSINGERGPWASNPWVWAVTFAVVAQQEAMAA